MKIKLLILLLVILSFLAVPIFGGEHFCYLPWAVDNGPGSVGCFYSSGSPHIATDEKGNKVLFYPTETPGIGIDENGNRVEYFEK